MFRLEGFFKIDPFAVLNSNAGFRFAPEYPRNRGHIGVLSAIAQMPGDAGSAGAGEQDSLQGFGMPGQCIGRFGERFELISRQGANMAPGAVRIQLKNGDQDVVQGSDAMLQFHAEKTK